MDWRIRRVPIRGAVRRRVHLLCALVLAAWLLDRYVPLGAPPANVAFWQVIALIAGAIGHFIHSAADAVVAALVATVQFLRAGVVLLGKGLKTGIFELGRGTARVLRAIKTFAIDTLPKFVKWSYNKLLKFSAWLKLKLGPVLKWLKEVKCHLDDIYTKYFKPVIDTIEFIRALNRTLQVFHINVLRELDSVLAQIEQRIEEPFLWVRGKITAIENLIDRIVTFDGLLQRITLLTSMSKYAPAWINGFWNRQIDPDLQAGSEEERTRAYPLHDAGTLGDDLSRFYRGDDSFMRAKVEELIALRAEELNGAT
jgi:hypothetical protein